MGSATARGRETTTANKDERAMASPFCQVRGNQPRVASRKLYATATHNLELLPRSLHRRRLNLAESDLAERLDLTPKLAHAGELAREAKDLNGKVTSMSSKDLEACKKAA